MTVRIQSVSGSRVTLELTIDLKDSMLGSEEAILAGTNEVGCALTGLALKAFDTDGRTIEQGGQRWHTKGQQPKTYQTPYGDVSIKRHVYQRSGGGKTFCPLEHDARIILTSTPQFCRQVSWKMAYGGARDVQQDLLNHGRPFQVYAIQRLAEAVSAVVQAKEEEWDYAPPAELDDQVHTVSVGLDGTCMLMCERHWREAMTGTVALYNREGERLYTMYLGATPEYGKATFPARLTREVERMKARYPEATFVGVADGTQSNWDYLADHVSVQVLDFYHASGYLGAAATATYPADAGKRRLWLKEMCHQLKHTTGAAGHLLRIMQTLQQDETLNEKQQEDLQKSITYYQNHQHQMNYPGYQQQQLPIGSGVTEAACKTLIKQRLCRSGMRWKDKGARVILSLRELALTPVRWQQFWDKLSDQGLSVAV
ncbi:MAG: ISKra4 family transposase [Thiolinea sp.]